MRQKIARKVRKGILRIGAKIIYEGTIAEGDWPKKHLGYECDIEINGKECWCAGRDPLSAYRLALETAEEIKNGELIF